MKRMILMRGVPGSGKSTLAKTLYEGTSVNYVILSTDDIFAAGNYYLWDRDGLGQAHNLNQIKCRVACQQEIEVIIIDNTNIKDWEREPYESLASQFGYTVTVMEPTTSWKYDAQECFRRTSHGVPLETIERMIVEIKK